MKMIEVDHVSKDYGNQKGVFDLCFSCDENETIGFLGPNGSGKTTTIRQLMGFIHPSSGVARIMGMDCFSQASLIQKHVGYLPGELALLEEMSGKALIEFIAKMKNMNDLKRAYELIDFLELDANVKIRKMSKGMKQKVGLVCAFMQDCKVLILDEPTSGLDPLMQQKFVELILEEKRKGKTILMSSHMFEEVENTCDRIIMIRQGRIVADQKMERILSNRKKHIEILFEHEHDACLFMEKYPLAVKKDKRIYFEEKENMNALLKEISEQKIMDINIRSQSLEELFMDTYGGNESCQ